MAYRVFIDNAAEKDIDRLPKNTRKLVLEEIKELAKDPRKPRAEPLEGNLPNPGPHATPHPLTGQPQNRDSHANRDVPQKSR